MVLQKIHQNESDSSLDNKVVKYRNIEFIILSPAGATPTRTDFLPIPFRDTPWCWEPELPSNTIQTMTDFTFLEACHRAVKIVWPNAE